MFAPEEGIMHINVTIRLIYCLLATVYSKYSQNVLQFFLFVCLLFFCYFMYYCDGDWQGIQHTEPVQVNDEGNKTMR